MPKFLSQILGTRCPEKSPLLASAALIKTWLKHVQSTGAKDDPVLKVSEAVVLLSH